MAGTKMTSRPRGGGVSTIGALPRITPSWPYVACASLGLAVVSAGAGHLLRQVGPSVVVAMCLALAAAAIATLGIRRTQRGRAFDPAIESVLPLIGARIPTRELVEPSKWTGGWIGVPSRIRIRYAATIDDTDPRFIPELLEQLQRRLGVEYRVQRHTPKKCRIVLELDPRTREEDIPEVARAEKVVKELLGAAAKVTCGLDDGGAVRSIDVSYDTSPRLSMSGYRQRVEKALSSMLPGLWRAHWDTEHDRVRFEIRPAMPTMVLHQPPAKRLELTHATYDACKFEYCVDEDGRILSWQPSVSPHMLIIGGTGSGKTAAEHTLLTGLAGAGWRVWVLDGKEVEFIGFRDWPNVELIADEVGQQVRMIHAAHELMRQRYTLIKRGEAKVSDFEPLLLIIDEYATFKAAVTEWYATVKQKGDPAKPPVFALVANLARLARTAKIHMVIGIQRPDVDFLGGEMRDNFGARLSLGRLSPQGANMMWDSFAIGVAIPRNQRGRGVALNAESNPVDVQTFYTPDPSKLTEDRVDEWRQLDSLRPAVTSYPRMMISEPTPDLEEILEPSYDQWASASIVPYSTSRAGHVLERVNALASATTAGVHFELADEFDASPAAGGDAFDGYSEPSPTALTDIGPGDLMLVDEQLELWGVVESCELDLLDDSNMSVDYRDFVTGEPNTVSVPEGDSVSVRRPV